MKDVAVLRRKGCSNIFLLFFFFRLIWIVTDRQVLYFQAQKQHDPNTFVIFLTLTDVR